MKMACMQKWAIGMLVLGIGMDRAAGGDWMCVWDLRRGLGRGLDADL